MATRATTGSSTVDQSKIAESMDKANIKQISQALIIQSYCNNIAQQPPVDFGNEPSLKEYQIKINDGLTLAQTHGVFYMNILQPMILTNMSNISNYYALNNSVATSLPAGSTIAEWITALNTLRSEGTKYQQAASDTVDQLNNFQKELTTDVNSFSTTVSDLNSAVLGDNGVLDSLNGQLKTLQSQIDGQIAGVTLGTLAIIGGSFMICVGAITDFVTAGTTTPLVVGGIGMVSGGVATDIGTAISLANLNNAKASLLAQEKQLKNEVKLAAGVQNGYSSLLGQVTRASDAALQMGSAWKTLTHDLDNMVNDLQNGIITTGQIQKLFLISANTTVKKVIANINTIKVQMAGVLTIVANDYQTVSDVIMVTAIANRKAYTSASKVSLIRYKYALKSSLGDSGPTTSSVADGINSANKANSSLALTIQNYAISVNQQPRVDFSGLEHLSKYETEINEGLSTAQTHANTYLNVIQPMIISNISNISNYYALHNAVATTLPPGSTTQEWIDALKALANQASTYQTDAKTVVTNIQTLTANLNADTATFSEIVTQLNSAVFGDNGELDTLKSEIHSIQKAIDGFIAGLVVSGLAILGGAFMAAVGSVAEFVTAGTSTTLVMGGVAIVTIGIGGEVASGITLKNLNDQKADILRQESSLKEEVKLATGISAAYDSLYNQVSVSVSAATGMRNAWESLYDDLGLMINNLQSGIMNTGEVREIFLTAANTTIQIVLQDTNIIKAQMAGVDSIVAPKGQTVGEAIVAATIANQVLSPHTVLLLKRSTAAVTGGILTQAVVNLNQAEQQVKNIVNLPTSAENIKNQSLENIPILVTQIQGLQGMVANFVNSVAPQLNDIETKLTTNQPLDQIKSEVTNVSNEADTLNTNVISVIAAIQRTINTTNTYFDQLSQIQGDLDTQKTQLQGQLGYAQSQESAAKKKYYYLIALGPFGLVGLAAASALYFQLKKDVNKYQSEIDSLNSQVNGLEAMNVATGLLSIQFTRVITSVTGLKNTVSFVSNDVLAINTDLGLGEARELIEVAVNAAITEVQTLSIDAS